jgi:stage V sporulation protein S
MNRFLSKLDLRDIKIDPRGSRFSPNEEDYDRLDESPVREDDPEPVVAASAVAFAPEPVLASKPELETIVASAESESVVQLNSDVVRAGEVLKVSARSRPSAVAGAIAGVVREAGRAEVQAIGAGATNQAVKAVAIAREYLRETGIDAVCLPAFIDVLIDNEDRTAIRLVIEPR